LARADSDYQEAAAKLSETLLGPITQQLGNKNLLLVSDGALDYIPFAALPIPASSRDKNNGAPLVTQHEIVNLPSASALAALRRDVAGRAKAARTLAVIADPVFEPDDPRVRRTTEMKLAVIESSRDEVLRSSRDFQPDDAGRILRLPFTRREALAISSLVPPSQRRRALDFDANRSTAMSGELAQYQFVHFATHGFLNTKHPELSGIVLSLVDERGAEQKGFLRANEIFNLKLPAELVVLSGCRTGLGKEIKGEGLLGLTRGFMYAGSARVLVSLWSVSDEASAELMARTYREMLGKQKLRPSAALRAAQISVAQTSRWKAPYYWAAFVLQGEPR
jgi:CHAT domain-containing protein